MAKATRIYLADPQDPIFTEGFSVTSLHRLTKPVQKDKPGKTPAAAKPTLKKGKSKLR
jgi:hypothetical protein|tara:strand:- start:1015 stop:1188 length:174 start_codon:yes stop_codon:yes gene_type:complete